MGVFIFQSLSLQLERPETGRKERICLTASVMFPVMYKFSLSPVLFHYLNPNLAYSVTGSIMTSFVTFLFFFHPSMNKLRISLLLPSSATLVQTEKGKTILILKSFATTVWNPSTLLVCLICLWYGILMCMKMQKMEFKNEHTFIVETILYSGTVSVVSMFILEQYRELVVKVVRSLENEENHKKKQVAEIKHTNTDFATTSSDIQRRHIMKPGLIKAAPAAMMVGESTQSAVPIPFQQTLGAVAIARPTAPTPSPSARPVVSVTTRIMSYREHLALLKMTRPTISTSPAMKIGRPSTLIPAVPTSSTSQMTYREHLVYLIKSIRKEQIRELAVLQQWLYNLNMSHLIHVFQQNRIVNLKLLSHINYADLVAWEIDVKDRLAILQGIENLPDVHYQIE
jgi:hypothetical protein